eukprot:g205.t1
MSSAHVRRLLKEYKEVQSNQRKRAKAMEQGSAGAYDSNNIELKPKDEDNLSLWDAWITGPPETPYAEAKFRLKIQVPSTYPHSPPMVHFVTKICHPNVHFKTGEICLDVLKDKWTPIWTLEATCRAIAALMSAPDASSPLNCDCGNLLRAGDMRGFWSLARMYTLEHAEPCVSKKPAPIPTASQHQKTD